MNARERFSAVCDFVPHVRTLKWEFGNTFSNLLRRLCDALTVEADAHPAVEVTMFHQPERGRDVLCLLNFQKELPNIPIEGIQLRLRLPGQPARSPGWTTPASIVYVLSC